MDNEKNRMTAVVALVVLGAFLAVTGMLWFFPIPKDNRDFINSTLGALQTFAAAAVFYYIGTSKSSAKKDEMIAQMTAPPGAPGGPAPPVPGS